MARRRKKTEAQQARQFGLVLPVVLGLVGGLALWRGHPALAAGAFAAAPIVLAVAFAAPGLWRHAFRGWMRGAEGLSWLMTRVVLSVFFFVVLTPFGLVMRLVGRTPLDLAWEDGRPSYWIDKPPGEYTLERYEKQY
jgi:hypothetical protein